MIECLTGKHEAQSSEPQCPPPPPHKRKWKLGLVSKNVKCSIWVSSAIKKLGKWKEHSVRVRPQSEPLYYWDCCRLGMAYGLETESPVWVFKRWSLAGHHWGLWLVLERGFVTLSHSLAPNLIVTMGPLISAMMEPSTMMSFPDLSWCWCHALEPAELWAK
jgi:hypothetical protein